MAIVVRENFVAAGTQLASSATEYVTAGANDKVAIDKLLLHNTGGSSETVKGYVEAAGGSPGAADQAFETAVPAGATRDVGFGVNITLGNSQGLFLSATTATTVNVHISGRRIVG